MTSGIPKQNTPQDLTWYVVRQETVNFLRKNFFQLKMTNLLGFGIDLLGQMRYSSVISSVVAKLACCKVVTKLGRIPIRCIKSVMGCFFLILLVRESIYGNATRQVKGEGVGWLGLLAAESYLFCSIERSILIIRL